VNGNRSRWGSSFPRENVVVTSRRVVRKAIAPPAKPRRPSTPYVGRFASYQKCGTSRAGGADSYLVRPLRSNKLSQHTAESDRFSEPYNVHFGARRSPETVLQAGNLYGSPTAARGSSQGIFVIVPTGVVRARFRILWLLPLAREAIP
jgi:hypothetical protein